jgi:hypothetical protein
VAAYALEHLVLAGQWKAGHFMVERGILLHFPRSSGVTHPAFESDFAVGRFLRRRELRDEKKSQKKFGPH